MGRVPIQNVLDDTESFDIGDGIKLERVQKFCYLGDMLCEEGGAASAVSARIRSAWCRFNELKPILTCKKIKNSLKGRVYVAEVRSCLLYASETCPMTKKLVREVGRTDVRMARWMCGVSLRDKI